MRFPHKRVTSNCKNHSDMLTQLVAVHTDHAEPYTNNRSIGLILVDNIDYVWPCVRACIRASTVLLHVRVNVHVIMNLF